MLFSWPSAGKDVIDDCASKTCGLEGRVCSVAAGAYVQTNCPPLRLCGSDSMRLDRGVGEGSQGDAAESARKELRWTRGCQRAGADTETERVFVDCFQEESAPQRESREWTWLDSRRRQRNDATRNYLVGHVAMRSWQGRGGAANPVNAQP